MYFSMTSRKLLTVTSMRKKTQDQCYAAFDKLSNSVATNKT